MTHDKFSEQVAAYALDALEPEDVPAFEAHLGQCDTCREEVDALQEAAALLGRAETTDVPELFRRRVLAAVAGEPQETAVQQSMEASRWRAGLFAAAAVVALVVATAAVVLTLTGGLDSDDVLQAADAVSVPVAATPDLTSPGVAGSFTFSNETDASVLSLASLPQAGNDSVYQLWFVGGERIEPSITFTPDDTGAVEVLVERGTAGADLIGITIEPAGGSAQPTTAILLTADLST